MYFSYINADIATASQRREILDWYDFKENLHKVGGSNNRLRDVETSLWRGKIDAAIATFADWDNPLVTNFLAYLERHRLRIPDYQAFQTQRITIGSDLVRCSHYRVTIDSHFIPLNLVTYPREESNRKKD